MCMQMPSVWVVCCSRCGLSQREVYWKRALFVGLEHVKKRGHWGSVTVAREVDDAEYVLSPWGMERRKRCEIKVA
jgi:hypothetical protein